ncbi:MAG: NAD-dependent epimerase/dehydratase family protein, partial [Acidimicrobiales bacterium]
MRVLVTGASGYVGSHVVAALVASGHSVRGLVRNPEKTARVLSRHGSPPIEVVPADMVHPEKVAEAVEGCDAVIHTAAVVALGRNEAAAAADANQRGAEVVLGAACRAGTEVVVHVSSAAVFSLTDGGPITEATPLTRAAGGYAASKVAVEQFVRGMQAAGAPVTLLYPVGIYGGIPTELDQTHEALAYWVNDATLVTSSGINVVDVRDVAEAAVRCIEQKVAGDRLVLAADYLPWADVGGFLEDLVQSEVPRVRIPGAVLRGMGRLVDESTAQRLAHATLREDPETAAVIAAEKKAEAVIAFTEVARDRVSHYGVAKPKEDSDVFELEDVIEKPGVDEAP